MQFRKIYSAAALFLVSALAARAAGYEPATILPPQPEREFRGAWISSIGEYSWLLQTGTDTAAQKAALISIMDLAVQLRLNAVIFQVRPACDALYASRYEPWSEHLTGAMGRAPQPFYDPLAFAIEEAHKRGLELHAWFNPYRALHFLSKSPIATNHISRTRPQLVRRYGKYLWLDPGERDVQDYTLNVVMDVVKRYDVDGVQFDDYFYPDRSSPGAESDFPDDASWKRFGAGGRLSRDDWRRENVNSLMQRVYFSIKSTKPWVKFGISPLGIWRPGSPPQVRGKDAYGEIYADARKWLVNGWVDYFSPQLYWPIEQKDQRFPVLLKWWAEQNSKGRHLWPGIAVFQANKWNPQEIPAQLQIVRSELSDPGYLLYNMTSLMGNGALVDTLRRSVNAEPALVPGSPWLGLPPGKPLLTVTNNTSSSVVKATWQTAGREIVRRWVVQTRLSGVWSTDFLSANRTSQVFPGTPPEAIAVSAVDRAGNVSPPAVVTLKRPPEPPPSPPVRPVTKRKFKKFTSPKNGPQR